MQTTINNGDSGLVVRNALNNMFTELYASLVFPIKITGVTANRSQSITANTYIQTISIVPVSGTPTIRIGTSPNGTDIMPDTVLDNFQEILVQQYFQSSVTLYITFTSGSGTLNFRISSIPNFF